MIILPKGAVVLDQGLWYSPASGQFFSSRYSGRNKNGPLREVVTKKRHVEFFSNGRTRQAHRMAWEIINGPIPTGLEIDHIDGNPKNNKMSNLRLVTHLENMGNYKMTRPNSSGLQGVSWMKNTKKWRAQINCNGERVYLGEFISKEAAHEVYLKAKRLHHGQISVNRLA